MPSFTNLGIASGLPLNDLVTGFLNAERIPAENRLNQKEETLNLELSGVGALKSALSSFQSTLNTLTASNAFNKQTISSSNDNISVISNGFASNGIFDVNVQQLATGSRLQSEAIASSTTTLGSGTLTLSAGAGSFDVEIDAADDISAIRDKINEQVDNFGVNVNVLNTDAGTFLLFNSSESGHGNDLTITSSSPALAAISTNNTIEQNAQSAIITVDGNTITNETNEFKNFIEDVTITANKVTGIGGESSTITISQDIDSANELINNFISSFNALSDALTGLGAPRQGRLAFDPNVRQVKQQITDVILNSVSGIGSIDNLQAIGIELNKDAKLQISTFSSENILTGQQRLNNAVNDDLDAVGKLFASEEGVATKISSIIDNYTESEGVLTLRERSLNEQLEDVDDDRIALIERLTDYENRLITQFTALDSSVAGFNSTGDFVRSALNSAQSSNDNS